MPLLLSQDHLEKIKFMAKNRFSIEEIAIAIDVDPDRLMFQIEDEEDSDAAWAYREGKRQKIEEELSDIQQAENGRKKKGRGSGFDLESYFD